MYKHVWLVLSTFFFI